MHGAGYSFITITEDHKVHPHSLNHQQHMSWFCVLFVHSLIDLLMRLRVPLPRGLDYVSGGIAWGFVGMSFIIHSNMVTDFYMRHTLQDHPFLLKQKKILRMWDTFGYVI